MFLVSIWWKSTKFVYGLEKKNAICGTINTLIYDGKQITMPNKINLTLKSFYENLFQKYIKICFWYWNFFKLDATTNYENYAKCETDITEDNLFVALKSMPNNKSPDNDGLS